MFNKILLSALLVFYSNIFHHTTSPAPKPQTIEGNVLFERTQRPAANVFVYVIEGEEESLTDARGYFKIVTWQKFPVHLTVKYKDHPSLKIKLSDASKQLIQLKIAE